MITQHDPNCSTETMAEYTAPFLSKSKDCWCCRIKVRYSHSRDSLNGPNPVAAVFSPKIKHTKISFFKMRTWSLLLAAATLCSPLFAAEPVYQGLPKSVTTPSRFNTAGDDVSRALEEPLIGYNDINIYNDIARRNDADTSKLFHRASSILEKLFQDLKQFIKNDRFDYSAFETRMSELRGDLVAVEFLVETELDPAPFRKSLAFVRYFFEVMVYCADKMKQYAPSESEPRGYVVLFEMLELRVRALALCDINGTLDTSVKGYRDRLGLLQRLWYVWGVDFRNLKAMAQGMTVLFESQTTQVKNTLDLLQGQLSERK
ncbi:hypothetical protein JCM33374_g3793 [Metschnikowia sp. JCM 33374]|nr:hypothetical protein JCM33374_g3793 [Metschnikowia sp. JCM 33374]